MWDTAIKQHFCQTDLLEITLFVFSPFNPERYAKVIEATALSYDLDTLPQGDRTNIGSDGITLSGGQKQRVSLARALYLESDLLVLDDIFSGLDADTEEQVFRQVFGQDGLLKQRGTTVVLCTHSTVHLPSADYIIALRGGSVEEQGTFSQLMSHQGYVQSLGLRAVGDSSSEKTASRKSVPGSEMSDSGCDHEFRQNNTATYADISTSTILA